MKNPFCVPLFLLVLILSESIQAATITFGGSGVWADYGLKDGTKSPFEVTMPQDGLIFTLTVTGDYNLNERLESSVLSAKSKNDNRWGVNDGALTVTLSVEEEISRLTSISLKELTVAALNKKNESISVIDSDGHSVVARGVAKDKSELDGPRLVSWGMKRNGLVSLSERDLDTWSLTLKPLEGESSGLGSIVFEYDYVEIPEPNTIALFAAFGVFGFTVYGRRKE